MLRSTLKRGLAMATIATLAATGATSAAVAAATPINSKGTTLGIDAASGTVNAKSKYRAAITGTLFRSPYIPCAMPRHRVPDCNALAKQKVVLDERKVGTTTWSAAGAAKVTNADGTVAFTVTQTNTKEQGA